MNSPAPTAQFGAGQPGEKRGAPMPVPRLRELVVMRIGWLTGCDYEWAQHRPVASMLGVSAESWAACSRELHSEATTLIELVTAIGAWRMIASLALGPPLGRAID